MSTLLTEKDPAEKFAISFDFTALMASITTATVTVEVISGVDATPSTLLNGSPQISGTTVLQRVDDGVSGAVYRLRCLANNATESFVLVAALPVITAV